MPPVLPWLVVIMTVAVLSGLLGCAQGKSVPNTAGEETRTDARELPMVNRIAYIDNTGDLRLINPDGTGEERLTGDVRAGLLSQALGRGDSYSWPTWSRDGATIAASRVSVGEADPEISVQLFDLATGRMISAYVNELPVPVADGTPHYMYWSPDDRQLSFLAPTPEGLTLFVHDLQTDEEAGAVAVGAPLYYHWMADSKLLAIHSGDRVTIQEPTPEGSESSVAVDAVAFRAPAISPDGSQVAYAGFGGGAHGIFLASTVSQESPPRMLIETAGLTAFAWAPDGSALAVAEQLRSGSPVFDRLQLVPADGTEISTVVDEQLLAFFWSPQGDRIAWVGIEPLSRSMALAVSEIESGKAAGEPRHLFRFSPNGELFTMLSFFDQYAYSHSIWSPDGSALVVTGTDGVESGRRNGSGPHGGQVFVVDVSSGEARRISSGKVAVWSWN